MSLLSVERLSLSINDRPILRDVSLTLDPGEVLGVVGESGSGKSMTALAILGLLPETARASGAVRLAGEDLTRVGEARLCALRGAAMGIVFQEPMTALNPLMTIGDQVAETIRLHGRTSRAEALTRARAALDRVELPGDRFPLDRYPHELSGGQRQRVAIAIATALSPRLVIADEPTTALDVTTQARILDLLRRLTRADGAGLILISHDLGVIAEMADRVAVMKDGAVVEAGPVASVLRAPANPYTRTLRAAATHRLGTPRPAPVAEAAPPVLSVQGVARTYPGRRLGLFRRGPPVPAVDRVDFDVAPGEIVGLVGESGCGKSTLLRAILALEPIQAGAIRIAGADLASARGARLGALRRSVQIVFQDPAGSFNPRHEIGRVVAEPLHLRETRPTAREREALVARALDQVGLDPAIARRLPHEFSGGQRQRIAIARALIVEPRLVALDEAVSALDVTSRAQILDLIADLSRRLGVAFLFVTHDFGVVGAVCDRVLVMRAGRIVEAGPTGQVLTRPRDPYTAELLSASLDPDRALARRFPEGAP